MSVRRHWQRVTWWVTPRRWARFVYLLVAAALVAAYYGVPASTLTAVPFLAPWLFGFGAATCIVGAVRLDRPAWSVSLTMTLAALIWRVTVIGTRIGSAGTRDIFTLDLTDPERVAVLGLGVYAVAILGVIAMWLLWLTPDRWD